MFDSLITSRFETQLTSNNLKRRNEKLDLHGAGRPPCTHGSSLQGDADQLRGRARLSEQADSRACERRHEGEQLDPQVGECVNVPRHVPQEPEGTRNLAAMLLRALRGVKLAGWTTVPSHSPGGCGSRPSR